MRRDGGAGEEEDSALETNCKFRRRDVVAGALSVEPIETVAELSPKTK